jgi:hypothetical protein
MAAGKEKSTSLLDVFGYPPDNLEPRTTMMIKKSMPVVSFFPSIPQFQNGLNLFTLNDAWKEYSDLLYNNGYTTLSGKDKGIRCAFLADNFPTDTFTNEYGENFLQKMTDVASEGAASISQMMGATSMSEGFDKLRKGLEKGGGGAEAVAKGMEWAQNMGSAAKSSLSNLGSIGNVAGSGINLLDKLGAGSRIDFPQVWKSSGYQPSYSFTVRLYNPWPQDDDSTDKYIIGPIVALMLLAVPRAQDSSTFTWPFLHRIECPGLFELDPGYIANVTVVKGGDQQQISFQHRLGIVDVRIDVGSLYSSMLAGSNKITSTRPTVLKYARAMAGKKDNVTSRELDNVAFVYGAGDSNNANRTVGRVNQDKANQLRSKGQFTPYNPFGPPDYSIVKTTSPKVQAEVNDPSLVDRVTDKAKEIYEKLKG